METMVTVEREKRKNTKMGSWSTKKGRTLTKKREEGRTLIGERSYGKHKEEREKRGIHINRG